MMGATSATDDGGVYGPALREESGRSICEGLTEPGKRGCGGAEKDREKGTRQHRDAPRADGKGICPKMVTSKKWLDAGQIAIENVGGVEEIPTDANIGRLYWKSRVT